MVVGLLFGLSGVVAAAPVSTQVVVTGVQRPATYDAAGLLALPAVTQTDTFTAGSVSQTHVFTGARLWDVLNTGGIPVNPAVKNDVLNKFVLATGTDGYRVVYSLGELHPNFGNEQALVAYADGGAPIGAAGFARTTAPGDVRGGRYVSNLSTLQVQSSASTQGATGGGASTSFTVLGAVAASRTFDFASLQTALPAKTLTVGAITYTGVYLWDLLSLIGIPVNAAVNNDILDKYLVATGSDGYKVVFSMGELNPLFGNQPDFIAYLANGIALGADGFARIIVPNDIQKGRWVSDLVSLEVFSAAQVPEPGTIALVLTGFGLLLVARRPRARSDAGVGARA